MHQDKRINDDTLPLPRSAQTAASEQRLAAELRARRIAEGENLGDVQRLRREVYFHEQGGYDSDRSKRIADGLDACGTTLAIDRGADTVATLRLHDFDSPAVQVEYGSLFQIDHFAQSWPLARVAVGTRFAVQADHRVKPVVDRLLEEAYRWLSEREIRFCLIGCESYLHGVFEHYGFREYLPPAILPGGIDLLRMVLVTEDESHLLECGSPLHRLVQHPAESIPAKAWLTRTFDMAW